MTIGERIAALRRAHDYSQEALGEALGVSRQAISKWEADASLPEIEKLVALSRLFGVTVGELLGVEEAAPEGAEPQAGEPTDGPAELTEQQLRMVEEIAARYIEALPAPQKPNRRRWLLAGGAAALVAAALCVQVWQTRDELASLRSQTYNLQGSIQQVSSSVGAQIESISGRVEETLKSQNNLTADYGCEQGTVDFRAGTVELSAWAVPKRYVEGMAAEFVVESGGERMAVPAELREGGQFAAAWVCPLDDMIAVSVRFDTDGVQETQLLDTFEGLKSDTLPWVECDLNFMFWAEEADRFRQARDYDVVAYFDRSEYLPEDYALSDAQIWVAVNGGAPLAMPTRGTITDGLQWADGQGEPDDGPGVAELRATLSVTLTPLTLAPGDTLEVCLTARDNYGRALRFHSMPSLYVDEDGRLDYADSSYTGVELIEE